MIPVYRSSREFVEAWEFRRLVDQTPRIEVEVGAKQAIELIGRLEESLKNPHSKGHVASCARLLVEALRGSLRADVSQVLKSHLACAAHPIVPSSFRFSIPADVVVSVIAMLLMVIGDGGRDWPLSWKFIREASARLPRRLLDYCAGDRAARCLRDEAAEN